MLHLFKAAFDNGLTQQCLWRLANSSPLCRIKKRCVSTNEYILLGLLWRAGIEDVCEVFASFPPVCHLQPLELIVPDVVTVRQTFWKQFFLNRPPVFRSGEQLLWKKKVWHLVLWTVLKKKKSECNSCNPPGVRRISKPWESLTANGLCGAGVWTSGMGTFIRQSNLNFHAP